MQWICIFRGQYIEEAEAWLPRLNSAGRDCDWVCGGEQAAETRVCKYEMKEFDTYNIS